MTSPIPSAAATGFARGAGAYERARPSYPEGAVACIVREGAVGPRTDLCDLAAGTGKLTRLLVPSGARIVAVEPVEEMRAELRAALPAIEVLDGTAEAIPLPDASIDVVTVAQAFHWFDAERALAELARVVRAGATLFVVWNVRDETVSWVHDFTELIVARGGGRPYTPAHEVGTGTPLPRAVSDQLVAGGWFAGVRHERFANPQTVTIDDVVERAASTSFVSALDDGDRADTLVAVRELLERHPDVPTGEFVFPHHTDVYWCRRA